MSSNVPIHKRIYYDYTKSFLPKILLSVFFAIIVAATTSAIAWLLDPAIKKIFIEKDQSLILIIPFAIIITFSLKGFSLYMAKKKMIEVSEEVKKDVQADMIKSLINADTQ